MNREFRLTLRPEPFWLQEAFACMNYVPMLDSEEWLNQNNNMSRQQKEEFLLPYHSYREAMRTRLQPILTQYPLLTAYVDSTPRIQGQSGSQEAPIMLFLAQMQDVLESEKLPEETALEAKLHQAFQNILECCRPASPEEQLSVDSRVLAAEQTSADLQPAPAPSEEQELTINGLSDMMATLEKWNGTDADKFKLLRLYSQRREVMEQLWSLQKSCQAIGRECLEPLRERFEACMEELKKPDTIENLFQEVGIQCEENCRGRITPTVMLCNQILIQMKQSREQPGHYAVNLQIGIETFFLSHSTENNLWPDEKLLARLKALSDSTRLKILHQLAKRPCYLQEMAKALELTPATVLHHLGILMAEELIELQVTSEKKKVYYRIREQRLEETSREILLLATPK